MQKYLCFIVALCLSISAIGCQSKSTSANKTSSDSTDQIASASPLDFDALLTSLDGTIGPRFQSMQMDSIQSTSYQYDGPIQAVLDIVEPIAKTAGFSEVSGDMKNSMETAQQAMQEKMGVDMKSVTYHMFTHPSGETLGVSRMDISNKNMKLSLLTVQLMNPKKMAELGEAAMKSSVRLPSEPSKSATPQASAPHQ